MTLVQSLRGALLASLLLPAGLLLAQEPKVGTDYYEDKVDLGFKVKVPKGWTQIPPQPGDPNLVVRYSAAFNNYIKIGKGENLGLGVFVIAFDKRKKGKEATSTGSDDEFDLGSVGAKDTLDWIKTRLVQGKHWREVESEDLKIKTVESARSIVYEAQHEDDEDALIRMFVAEYTLEPGLKIAFLGNGPGDRKWNKYESAYEKLAKSFERVEVETLAGGTSTDSNTPRGKKRAQLQLEVAKLSGWNLYETENYFIVSDVTDKGFMDELMVRIEAIRDVYEETYPPEQARAILAEKKELEDKKRRDKKAEDDEPEDGEPDDEEPQEDRSISALDPIEASRTSVLRVCSTEAMYHKYAPGSGGSAGYWNSAVQELVIYDDKQGGGRRDTWIVLNHEAFHQYIFYFYGALAPHSWYNEGTGDFYSGYEYKHKKFNLKENPWRKTTIQSAINTGKYVPLREFVTWTQLQYYGQNDMGVERGICYAQGWSFIYFLRTGPTAKPRGWNKDWNDILDKYLRTLGTTGDLEAAVETAFAGVNWHELEDAWKRCIAP